MWKWHTGNWTRLCKMHLLCCRRVGLGYVNRNLTVGFIGQGRANIAALNGFPFERNVSNR